MKIHISYDLQIKFPIPEIGFTELWKLPQAYHFNNFGEIVISINIWEVWELIERLLS